MRVFNEYPRTDPAPARHSESHAAFLARARGDFWDAVRSLVEGWFSNFCRDAQEDLRSRLRSSDDRHFSGAVLELYLYECLLRSGYEVVCHPDIGAGLRRPDFLATRGSESLVIEARSISASDDRVAAENRRTSVYDALDRLKSPNFFLWIDVDQEAPQPLPTKELRNSLVKWLSTLDPDRELETDGAGHRLPEFSWSREGWEINFRAIAKSSEVRGESEGLRPLGVFGGRQAVWSDDATPMRQALSEKGKAYGDVGRPFVVALGTSFFSNDSFGVVNTLYGTEQIEIRWGPNGETATRSSRAPDGYFCGGAEWKHRSVSGVLVVNNLHPAFVASQVHTLWEHPDPLYPVAAAPGVWRRAATQGGTLEYIEPSVSQRDLFGLPDPWPPGEPFSER